MHEHSDATPHRGALPVAVINQPETLSVHVSMPVAVE
jgi:hypothetical protein